MTDDIIKPQDAPPASTVAQPATRAGWAWQKTKNGWRHVADFMHTWQEVLVWLPIVMSGVLFFNSWVGMVDPASGKDGLGALTGYAMLGVRYVLSAAAAFFIKRTYFGFMKPREIRELKARVADGDANAYTLLRMDRIEWIPCLIFGYFCFSQV